MTTAQSITAAWTAARNPILAAHGYAPGTKGVRVQNGSIVLWGELRGRWVRITDEDQATVKARARHLADAGTPWQILPANARP